MIDFILVALLLLLSVLHISAAGIWKRQLLFLATILLIIHFFTGWRWHFIPADVATVSLLLIGIGARRSPVFKEMLFGWKKTVGLIILSSF